MTAGRLNLRALVAAAAVVISLAGAATVALAGANGAFRHGWVAPDGECTVHVPSGTVSFRVANTGSLVHQLVVLPLPSGQSVGGRAINTDTRVDETGSVAEASLTCGAGAGDGTNPGTISWISVILTRGTYELVCNLPGHYAAGMYTTPTVS